MTVLRLGLGTALAMDSATRMFAVRLRMFVLGLAALVAMRIDFWTRCGIGQELDSGSGPDLPGPLRSWLAFRRHPLPASLIAVARV